MPTNLPTSAHTRVALDDATLRDFQVAFDAGTLTAQALVERSLARIAAFDRQGPCLNAVIALHPGSLETARALDAERRKQGPRSPLHGIPVVLKDNLDTFDLPTTGGSVLLQGSIPPDDAFVVHQLRAAGAVILAKVNLSEFAAGAAMSSIQGHTRNPHDLTRTSSGSSGGTGVAVAAGYAPIGVGTDTGGSIRGPAAANGIAALKPTRGLLSRDGIIPLSPSLDTAGPMARHVYDLAAALGVMTGVDPADQGTHTGPEQARRDYTAGLHTQALSGVRLGVARDFAGADDEVDQVFAASLAVLQGAGAQLVNVHYPRWLLDVKDGLFNAIRMPEFAAHIALYLATLGPAYPRSLAQMIERTRRISPQGDDSTGTNPVRWAQFEAEAASGPIDSAPYTSLISHGLPLVQGVVEGLFQTHRVQAIVYPTAIRRAAQAQAYNAHPAGPATGSAANLANMAGLPDLVVPAGWTRDGLPVCLSFLGTAFSEPQLLALGYAFEQATRARRQPIHTPALAGESIRVPLAPAQA